MARYEQLQVRKDTLYLAGSPITIEAEALLFDNKSKTLSAQVKFANVGSRDIDTLVAEYRPTAAMGRELELVVYQYRCGGATPGSEFGQAEPVKLPAETVDFSSRVLRVGFSNGDVWDAPEDSEWKKQPSQNSLAEAIGDKRLLEQYTISVGDGLTFVPRELGLGTWVCGCGTINDPTRATCVTCGTSFEEQLKHLDSELLGRELEARKERERIQAEEQSRLEAERLATEAEEAERRRLQEEERQKAQRALRKRAAIILAAVAVVLFSAIVFNRAILPSLQTASAQREAEKLNGEKISEAKRLYSEGKYDEAWAILYAMDSDESVDELKKSIALTAGRSLEESGDYIGAVAWYQRAGDDNLEREAKYNYVMSSLDSPDEITYQYLDDLQSVEYKDSAALYKEMCTWDVELAGIQVEGRNNGFNADFYLVYKITDGIPGQEITFDVKYDSVGIYGSDQQKAGEEATEEDSTTISLSLETFANDLRKYNKDGYTRHPLLVGHASPNLYSSLSATITVSGNEQTITETIALK